MTIRAITFDFWGTLFRDANGTERHLMRVKALRDATGVSEEEADDALQDIMAYFMQQHLETQHTLRPPDAVQLACDRFGVSLDEAVSGDLATVFGTAILAHPPAPILNALEAVQAAAARVPVALISDTGFSPGKNLRVLLEREGFLPHFKAMTFSDETGVAKPQRFMFESTAAQLGVEAHELLHIGDLEPTDIVGAHQVNGKAGLFTAVNARYAAVTRADFVFPSWGHFLDVLPELV